MTANNRRSILQGIGALSTGALAGVAGCLGGDEESEYPTEDDVTIVVPYSTGGGFDEYARLSQEYWQNHLPGDPNVVVENITGGGGVTGATNVYNADPDGYTMLIWDHWDSAMPQVGHDVGYDIQEMSHIGALTQAPNGMTVMEGTGISTWDEFVEHVGEYNWVTQGTGSISHISPIILGELTGEFTRDDLSFVHYDGTGEALGGLERDEGQLFMVGHMTGAVQVATSIEEAELFMAFTDRETTETFTDPDNVSEIAGELDVENLAEYSDLAVFRRFFTGPPDVSEEILEIQREAFANLVEDEEFQETIRGADRRIINPGDHEEVEETLDQAFETFSSDPYIDIIQGAFE